jgi:hypothetical protein
MTAGFGLRAEDADLALLNRTEKCAVLLRCGGGIGGNRQASPVNRTMPGKRVLPTVGANTATTTLKGLGGIGPAFEGKRSSAGSLAQNARKADNQTI